MVARLDAFRVFADARDLNYTIFTTQGMAVDPADTSDYNSHTTRRLTRKETVELLMGLPEVREALA